MFIKSLKLARADSLAFRQDLLFYPQTKQWKNYVVSNTEFVGKYLLGDTKALNEIGNNYIAAVNDQNDLKQAIEWVKLSNAKNETHETNFIIARLYQKTGDKKQALDYALKSKDIVTRNGFDSKKIDDFIASLRENR